jgi:hypothetical protein
MPKPIRTSKKNRFPKGWDEARVRRLLQHYEGQTDEEAAAEDDAIFNDKKSTFMQIPARLVPAVRKLLQKKASSLRSHRGTFRGSCASIVR